MNQDKKTISLTFLVDNTASEECGAEHGLSILIEGDETILFDAGQSGLFLENAVKCHKDIESVQTVVLSHGHYDHGNGLNHFSGRRLICHPGCFIKRYRREKHAYIGLNFDINAAANNFSLQLSASPASVTDTITYLGQIPRLNDFENRSTSFVDENGNTDHVTDDSALAIKTRDGLIIISGCAHSGICNIIDYACKVMRTSEVVAVIGGFHLKHDSEALQPTVEYLSSLQGTSFWPCHCVDETAMQLLHRHLNCESVHSGKSLNFNI